MSRAIARTYAAVIFIRSQSTVFGLLTDEDGPALLAQALRCASRYSRRCRTRGCARRCPQGLRWMANVLANGRLPEPVKYQLEVARRDAARRAGRVSGSGYVPLQPPRIPACPNHCPAGYAGNSIQPS